MTTPPSTDSLVLAESLVLLHGTLLHKRTPANLSHKSWCHEEKEQRKKNECPNNRQIYISLSKPLRHLAPFIKLFNLYSNL